EEVNSRTVLAVDHGRGRSVPPEARRERARCGARGSRQPPRWRAVVDARRLRALRREPAAAAPSPAGLAAPTTSLPGCSQRDLDLHVRRPPLEEALEGGDRVVEGEGIADEGGEVHGIARGAGERLMQL